MRSSTQRTQLFSSATCLNSWSVVSNCYPLINPLGTNRFADDLPAERQAVHHRADFRSRIQCGISDVQSGFVDTEWAAERAEHAETKLTLRVLCALRLISPEVLIFFPKGHHQHVAIRWQCWVDRFDWRHAVGDTRVVDERGIERIGQREVTERLAVESID